MRVREKALLFVSLFFLGGAIYGGTPFAVTFLIAIAVFLVLLVIAMQLGGMGVSAIVPEDHIIPITPSQRVPHPESSHLPANSAAFLPVDGVNNFRDLGGYLTSNGKQYVKRGVVFRCGEFFALTEKGADTLSRLRLRSVLDLRSFSERKRCPNKNLPETVTQHIHLPVYNDQNKGAKTFRFMKTLFFHRRNIGEVYKITYTEFIDLGASYYGNFLRHFASPSNYPIAFHCSAGKDRTGLGAAFLLHICGVPFSTILSDYTQSNHFLQRMQNYFMEGRSSYGVPAYQLSALFHGES